jgi:high-affinity nickel permease
VFWFTGMMQSEIASASGLLLMLVLGLRHGLDPDHVACIDGLTWRAMQHGRHHSPWVGTLFAIGHGLLVTMVAVVFSQVGRVVEVATGRGSLTGCLPHCYCWWRF